MLNRIKKDLKNTLLYSLLAINFLRIAFIILFELFIVGICVAIAKKYDIEILFKYARNKALGLDEWANAELLGHPSETISSRLGRTIGKERYFWVKWLRKCVDYVALKYFDDPEHCENSIITLEQESFKEVDYEIWDWIKHG